MAPGIPEVAAKYHITDPTIIALTLSIFLISFALGVSNIPLRFGALTRITAFDPCTIIRNVWANMGECRNPEKWRF